VRITLYTVFAMVGGVAISLGQTDDFGDAPAPYPTLQADNGASHTDTGPLLGTSRDTELDGQPTDGADGDDTVGTDDEDGVDVGPLQVGRLDESAAVTVSNAPAGARLDAWIDFNADGSWGGPFERIAHNIAVVNGVTTFDFDVPSWAVAGTNASRFRVSSVGSLGTRGSAVDGEVEDYVVMIAPPKPEAGVFNEQPLITDSANGVFSIFATDIDGDGDTDVLSASVFDRIAWYENDGNEVFTTHTITEDADGPRSVYAADIDGDGDVDVLTASADDNAIRWFENDGSQNFSTNLINASALFAFGVSAADIDTDGDMDVLSASNNDNKIVLYENDGAQNFSTNIITTSASGARQAIAVDVDGDGDMDVVSVSFSNGQITWYDNDGSQNFSTNIIVSSLGGPAAVFATDLDRDGDMDVLSALFVGDQATWYENDGNQNFTEHIISDTIDGPNSIFAADLDGDHDIDVMTSSGNDDMITWFENDGTQNFSTNLISTNGNFATAVFAADVDQDGDIDLIASSRVDGEIAWYEHVPVPPFETWVGQFGLPPGQDDPDDDADDDGMDNLEEWISGTNPGDSNDLFEVTDVNVLSGSNCVWWRYGTNTEIETAFSLWRATNLVNLVYEEIAGGIARNPSGTNVYYDTDSPTPSAVYRPVLPTNHP